MYAEKVKSFSNIIANNNPSPNTRFVGTGNAIKNNQKGFNVRFPEPDREIGSKTPSF